MLHRKLTKADYEALATDALKALYKQVGDAFILQVEPDEDTGALNRALDRERQIAKDEKARADRLQQQYDEVIRDPNKAKDISVLEESWKQKLNDANKAHAAVVTKLNSQLEKTLVKDAALVLATQLAGDKATILLPHIEARLKADLSGDVAFTRVLDNKGQLSAATIDDLRKEFVDNKQFEGIIIASKANGGADGKRNGTASIAVLKTKKFNELTEAERIEFHKSDPEEFKKASEAYKASLQQQRPARRF